MSLKADADVVTRDQILRIIGNRGLRRLFTTNAVDLEEESDEDPYVAVWGRARPRAARRHPEFEKVPSEAGKALMASGTFGVNDRPADTIQRKKRLAARLLRREMGLGSVGRQRARSGLLKQVGDFNSILWASGLTWSALGPHPFLQSRYNRTLQRPLLLRPILWRWKLLLLLRARHESPHV